mgnify:CR=1 FL=1
MKNTTKIRILIADDHALVREGIRSLLSRYDDLEVVGEAEDGKQAISRTLELNPDVVLMDIAMPGLGGLEATLELRRVAPATKVLVLTQYADKEYVYRFLKAGARGYLLKKALSGELVSAIRAVHRGGVFLHPSVAAPVVEDYLQEPKERGYEGGYESLTDREKQVLKLIAEGCSSREIADLLNISIKTVMGHRTSIMTKLDIHNRADLIKFAISKGLIQVETKKM